MAVYARRKSRRESTLESNAVKWARARGVVAAKLTKCDGVPDRIFFLPRGKTLIIEFKRRGEQPEEGGAQEWYLAKMLKDGHNVGWCDTREGFIEAMRKAGIS